MATRRSAARGRSAPKTKAEEQKDLASSGAPETNRSEGASSSSTSGTKASASAADKKVSPASPNRKSDQGASSPGGTSATSLVVGVVAGVVGFGLAYGLLSSGILPSQLAGQDEQTALTDRLAALETSLSEVSANLARNGTADEARAEQLKQLAPLVSRLDEIEGRLSSGIRPLQLSRLEEALASSNEKIARLETQLIDFQSQQAGQTDQDSLSRYRLALALIQNALNEGRPFVNELALLNDLLGDRESLDGLKVASIEGGLSDEDLNDLFLSKRDAMSEAALMPENPGLMDKVYSIMRGAVRVRTVGMVEGDEASARLARMSVYLKEGDLSAAIKDYEGLPPAAQEVGREWAEAARARLRALSSLEQLIKDLNTDASHD